MQLLWSMLLSGLYHISFLNMSVHVYSDVTEAEVVLEAPISSAVRSDETQLETQQVP